ncbi:MAG: hypothetical protein HOP17_14405 [Acidobacteria bacterium]|nr:hypothetical protein [Acidobacteriota bacterium]
MKKLFLLVAMFVIAAASIAAQENKQIASIRAEVSSINKSAAKYQKKTRDVEGVSLEGTEATYFTSGKGLKKIVAKMYGETFRATAELYYSGEEMIFAYQRMERYDTQIAANPPPKVVKVIETRVYYAGANAIRVIEGKKQLASQGAEFHGAEEAMNDLSQKLKAAIEP